MLITAKAKKFSLVFPEGRGLCAGWILLAKKLRSLGVIPTTEARRVALSTERRNSPRLETNVVPFVDIVKRQGAWLETKFSSI